MQKRLLRWELIGFAFTGAVGTLLHFVYEWTGGNPLIAAFCAVNESTWEHMKLLAVPWLVWTVVTIAANRCAASGCGVFAGW